MQYEKREAARSERREIGFEHDEKIGLECGAMQKQCEIARNLKMSEISLKMIFENTGLSTKEIGRERLHCARIFTV